MIVRLWRGQATADQADAYARHVTETVLPALGAIPGYRGASVLRRELEAAGQIEFLVMTRWESLQAVREFAGADVTTAVVEPAARAVLTDFDRVVTHYNLVYDAASPG